MENWSRPITAVGEWDLDRQGEQNCWLNHEGPKGSWRLVLSFFIENFIEIIIDPHAIVRNNTQRVPLCALCPFPPVVRFCTVVIPQPGCYISITHWAYSDFPAVCACRHIWVNVYMHGWAHAFRLVRLYTVSFLFCQSEYREVAALQGALGCSLLTLLGSVLPFLSLSISVFRQPPICPPFLRCYHFKLFFFFLISRIDSALHCLLTPVFS